MKDATDGRDVICKGFAKLGLSRGLHEPMLDTEILRWTEDERLQQNEICHSILTQQQAVQVWQKTQ